MSLNLPIAQLVQSPAATPPVPVPYVPAAHCVHAEDAAVAPNLPATQLWHTLATLAPVVPLYDPAAQLLHTLAPLAVA